MSSFIFNSKSKYSSRSRWNIDVFVVTFFLIWLTGEIMIHKTAANSYAHPGPSARELPPGDWYLDTGYGISSMSHEIFYYRLGPSIRNAKKSDILFLGHSRALFGLAYESLNEFALQRNIRYFILALQYNESGVFPEAVIRKHDLRSKWVIVNVDHFFTGNASDKAKSVLKNSSWEYFKGRVDGWGLYFYQIYMRKIFPHYMPDTSNHLAAAALMRSPYNGSQFRWRWPNRGKPVIRGAGINTIEPEELKAALEFRDFIQGRGGNLILMHVPSAKANAHSRIRAQKMAAQLGVPFVSPDLDNLSTADRTHLNTESAREFTSAFLKDLSKVIER